MDIQAGYIVGGSALAFFSAGWLFIGFLQRRQELADFRESTAGQFAARLKAGGGLMPWMRHFAVDPDGSIYAYPCQPDLFPDGWRTDRECGVIGIDTEAAKHWRETWVTRRMLDRL